MNGNQSLFRVAAVLAGAAVVYLIGGYSASRDLWPWPWARYTKIMLFPWAEPHYDPMSVFRFDNIGRLTSKTDSDRVTCPQQDERTTVIFILGQSNAGNHGGQKTKSEYGSKIVNFFEGRCYIAASPLLGS